jgi:hypothetical protein
VEETGGRERLVILSSLGSVSHAFSIVTPGGAKVRNVERSSVRGIMQMNRPPSKTFRCEVVSETVTISLRRRTPLSGKGKLFVRCSEVDCQYVDENEPPCPLTLDLFAAEVRERETPRAE